MLVMMKSYLSQAELLLKNYVFSDSSVVYTSVVIGIFACEMVYYLTHLVSAVYSKSYSKLTRSRQIEWNNRAMSTFHAVFITFASLYFVCWSDLYRDDLFHSPITRRSSTLSTFALGVSLGYFLSDLGMIVWFYPSLGGMEYVIHHLLSVVSVGYAVLTREAQLYAFMLLMSEATTPGINIRWYLDAAGMKRSRAYVTNGVVIFLSWLVARIVLFVYLFYHVYLHYNQVIQMHRTGVLLIFLVSPLLSVMNLIWFWKIFIGLKKILAKRQ